MDRTSRQSSLVTWSRVFWVKQLQTIEVGQTASIMPVKHKHWLIDCCHRIMTFPRHVWHEIESRARFNSSCQGQFTLFSPTHLSLRWLRFKMSWIFHSEQFRISSPSLKPISASHLSCSRIPQNLKMSPYHNTLHCTLFSFTGGTHVLIGIPPLPGGHIIAARQEGCIVFSEIRLWLGAFQRFQNLPSTQGWETELKENTMQFIVFPYIQRQTGATLFSRHWCLVKSLAFLQGKTTLKLRHQTCLYLKGRL